MYVSHDIGHRKNFPLYRRRQNISQLHWMYHLPHAVANKLDRSCTAACTHKHTHSHQVRSMFAKLFRWLIFFCSRTMNRVARCMFAFDYVKIGMNNAKKQRHKSDKPSVVWLFAWIGFLCSKHSAKLEWFECTYTLSKRHIRANREKRALGEQMEENKLQPQTTNRNLFFDWRYVRTLWDSVMVVLKEAINEEMKSDAFVGHMSSNACSLR